MRFRGKLYRRKLDADDTALAKRKLREFKNDLERTDATRGNTSSEKVLEAYAATLTGADSTKEKKLAVPTWILFCTAFILAHAKEFSPG